MASAGMAAKSMMPSSRSFRLSLVPAVWNTLSCTSRIGASDLLCQGFEKFEIVRPTLVSGDLPGAGLRLAVRVVKPAAKRQHRQEQRHERQHTGTRRLTVSRGGLRSWFVQSAVISVCPRIIPHCVAERLEQTDRVRVLAGPELRMPLNGQRKAFCVLLPTRLRWFHPVPARWPQVRRPVWQRPGGERYSPWCRTSSGSVCSKLPGSIAMGCAGP
jgi:hypothetical protein